MTDTFPSATRRGASLLALLLLAGASQPRADGIAAGQDTPAPVVDELGAALPITPGDLDRIRKALESSSPVLKIDDGQLRYYVQILAKQKTFADYVKGYDLLNGPTKGGNPMTHREFLALVTPKEFYSSGGITAWEQLQFALTNYLGQTFVKKAIEDLQHARDAREVDEIRDRIERELSALRRRPAPPPAAAPAGDPASPTPSPEPTR